MRKFLPYAVLVVWFGGLYAENQAQTSDTTIYRQLEQVDVKAKKHRSQTSVVQSVKIEQLEIAAQTDIASVLRTFNGLNIKDYGGVGGLKTVSVRSLGASHTAVDYDGVPVSNTQAGQIDISRFDISTISEIKLAVGQDDNLLKPAKLFASGATLGISSEQDFSKKHNFETTLKAGSFGYFFVNGIYACKLSDNLTVKADYEFLRSDGRYPFILKNLKNESRERRTNSDINSHKAEINLFYNAGSKTALNIKVYLYDSKRGLPGSVVYYYNNANERLNDKNYFVQTKYKRQIFSNLTMMLIAKYNYSQSFYTDRNVMYQNGLLEQNSVQNEVYLSWANLWQIASPLSFSLAVDDSYNTLVSDITDREPKRNTIVSAANLRYNFQNFAEITIGEVFTHLRENTPHGSHFEDLDRFAPLAKFSVFPFKDFSATILLKNTYRVPTFNELYYTTLGSTNLKPEDAKELNFGIAYTKSKFRATADFYRNNVENKIVAIPTLYIWKMANYGKVRITGADLSMDKEFCLRAVAMDFSAGYSYQEALDITDKKSKLYRSQIPYTPLHSGNFGATFKIKKIAFNVVSVFSGKRYFLAYNIKDNEIDPYAEFSASVSRKFAIRESCLFVKFSCINFTDQQYDVIKFYPMPGRQYRLELKFSL